MKKVLSILLISLLVLTGCEKESIDTNTTNSTPTNSKKVVSVAKIDDSEIELSSEGSFYDMHFMTSSKIHANTSGSLKTLTYSKDDNLSNPTIVINILKYSNKTISEVLDGTSYELTKKKYNDIEYVYFKYNDLEKDGHTYLYEFNKNTYTINFISDKDMNEFEEVFLKNVSYIKENN